MQARKRVQPPPALRRVRKSRVWFYRPSWWFDGWSPIAVSHDEFSRRTLVVGWAVTGRIIIALGYCGDPECYAESLRWLDVYA